ncbi:MAG: histidinol-phosphate transaminase [Methanomassiliicoccales archaeon]|nr:histidinol-phosphate transaminase [Methanomassiliicoccales archaeon]
MGEEWIRSSLRDVPLYYNPKTDAFRMDNNANLLGPNPVAKRVLRELAETDVNFYPTTYSDPLRTALAEFYGLEMDNFIAGNGSDEMLDVCFKMLLQCGEKVVTPHPTYALHSFFVKVNAGKMVQVDLNKSFDLDPDEINRTDGKLVLLCTPNNPTANAFKGKDIIEIIEGKNRPVIVDEAYGEFTKDSFIGLVNDYDNLIVTRTFSKAYGLAGMRVGYAVSNKTLAQTLLRAKTPLSLNLLSERVAIAALKDTEYVKRTVQMVDKNRGPLSKGLRALGFRVFPSNANFILTRSPMHSEKVVSNLAEKGILIRDFGKVRMLEDCVRITIGTSEMNARLLARLAEVLEECR